MNRKIFVPLIAVFTGLLVAVSCTKLDTTDLGKELIPEVDNINTFETILDVITDNVKFDDTTRLYNYLRSSSFEDPNLQPVMIGEIADDAEFGKTTGAAYFSLSPGSYGTYPFVKRDTVKIDSVILSLTYATQYGDSLAREEFEVYHIDPNTSFGDSVYFIKSPDFAVTGGRIGHKQVDFQTLNDSLSYVNVKDTIRTINELRIPLDTAFGRAFVNYDTATQYKNDSIFRVNFKGLAVKVNGGASPNPRALAYFNLTGASTRVTFYCRVQNNGKTDTIAPTFVYSYRQHNAVRRAEQHGYQQYLTNGNPSDDKIYLASSPGSYASVKIPGLDTMTNKAIHRAELILERIASNDDNYYAPPPLLYIDGMNNTADSFFTVRGDFVYTQGSGLGYDISSLEGVYTSKQNRYTFNLSRHVQSVIGPKKLRNHTLRVYAPFVTFNYLASVTGAVSAFRLPMYINDPIASGRVVLGGGSNPIQKMRLRIIYSKI